MKDWRENSLLARQTEAVKQMLSLNQVSSVSKFTWYLKKTFPIISRCALRIFIIIFLCRDGSGFAFVPIIEFEIPANDSIDC